VFDFRYHALSLAAVLIALTVGLLLGVAIGDANLVSNAEKHLRDTLRADVNAARRDAGALRAQLALRARYETDAYPRLVGGRLAGKQIGLLFLGQSSDQVSGLVRSALNGTGGKLVLVAAIHEPPDLSGIAGRAGSTRYKALASDNSLLRPFGVRIGRQLVRGGRLLAQVSSKLLSSYSGTLGKLDGLIVMRNRGNLDANSDTFEAGLASGLGTSGVAVVGVETSTTNPSVVPWYQQQNLTNVDDLDDLAGRTALVYALAGARGSFGVKSTAEALLPGGGGSK
jgi:hypothetical protein